jgi:hypothetical protein
MYEVFINYRAADSGAYAALLRLALERRFGGRSAFLDSESIRAGADYVETLLARVRSCRVLLALIGPEWLAGDRAGGGRRIDDPGDWVRRELKEAFAAGVMVIPVLVDGARMPVAADLPADIAALAKRQYRMLRHRDASSDLARILADVAAADLGVGRAGPAAVRGGWRAAGGDGRGDPGRGFRGAVRRPGRGWAGGGSQRVAGSGGRGGSGPQAAGGGGPGRVVPDR